MPEKGKGWAEDAMGWGAGLGRKEGGRTGGGVRGGVRAPELSSGQGCGYRSSGPYPTPSSVRSGDIFLGEAAGPTRGHACGCLCGETRKDLVDQGHLQEWCPLSWD